MEKYIQINFHYNEDSSCDDNEILIVDDKDFNKVVGIIKKAKEKYEHKLSETLKKYGDFRAYLNETLINNNIAFMYFTPDAQFTINY